MDYLKSTDVNYLGHLNPMSFRTPKKKKTWTLAPENNQRIYYNTKVCM